MNTIAILGANGRCGRVVAQQFVRSGWKVRAVTRDGKYKGQGKLETVAADALNRDSLIKATAGVDVVFNGLNPPYTRWLQECMPQAKNVIAACQANRATHLFIGNIYNFGTTMPERLIESVPRVADTRKGRIREDMESYFGEAAKTENVQTLIIRAGDFFGGTGTGSWFDLVLANKLNKGSFTYPGPMDCKHAWAYLPDMARAFVALAQKRNQVGQYETYHFEGHNITGQQMLDAFETITGRRLKVKSIPWSLIRLMGFVHPMSREISEIAYLWKTPHQMDGTRLEAIIGKLPKTQLGLALETAAGDLGFLDNEELDQRMASASTPSRR